MWKTVLSYGLSATNYNITNMNNLYNCLLSTMDILNDEQKQPFIDSVIVNMGQTFYKSFRAYTINKIPNSTHLQFMRI